MSGIKAPGDDDKVVPDGQGDVKAAEDAIAPEAVHTDEVKETVPETDEEIKAVNDEIHQLVLEVAKAPDYSASLEKLGECKNFEALFDAVNKEANQLLSQEPAVQIVVQRIADSIGPENFTPEIRSALKTAVETNDFDNLKFSRRSREYGLTLALTAIKNNIVRDLTTQVLDKHGDSLGLSKSEITVMKGYLKMISSMDKIYIKWRTELYPPELLKLLREMEGKGEDPKEYLKKNKLDDPYAVVKDKGDGKYESVPYAVAFAQDYEELLTTLRITIKQVETYGPAAFGEHMDRDRTLTYLNAYKKALTLKRSKKIGSEWESVRLWKDVDRAWIKCQDRLQIVHGIESGYDASSDPSEVKVIPELKLVIQTTTPNSERLIKQMKEENAEVFPKWLNSKLGRKSRKAAETYIPTAKSHVGIVTMINGGGNSMDFRGTAQMGPNYEDVQQESGVKAFVDTKSQSKVHRDSVCKNVFGAEGYDDKWTIKESDMEDQYNAQFIASHELGHVFIEDIGDFDEAKATWVGLISLHERVKNGTLPKSLDMLAIKEHVKYCLGYLASTEEDVNNYGREGIANIRIFLKTGLLTKGAGGKYEFHEDKVDKTYEEMGDVFAKLVELYVDPKRETEGSPANAAYNEYVDSMTKLGGEYGAELAELKKVGKSGGEKKEDKSEEGKKPAGEKGGKGKKGGRDGNAEKGAVEKSSKGKH